MDDRITNGSNGGDDVSVDVVVSRDRVIKPPSSLENRGIEGESDRVSCLVVVFPYCIVPRRGVYVWA